MSPAIDVLFDLLALRNVLAPTRDSSLTWLVVLIALTLLSFLIGKIDTLPVPSSVWKSFFRRVRELVEDWPALTLLARDIRRVLLPLEDEADIVSATGWGWTGWSSVYWISSIKSDMTSIESSTVIFFLTEGEEGRGGAVTSMSTDIGMWEMVLFVSVAIFSCD